jgi:hypothetical protein
MTKPLRLYLDTAILIDRADGRIDPELARRLDSAVLRKHAQVVVSVAHFWDIHASLSDVDRARAVATIGELPNLRRVVVPPSKIEAPRIESAMRGEPFDSETPDIVLGLVEDLPGIIQETRNGFVALAQMGSGMAEAGNTARVASSGGRASPTAEEFFRRLIGGESPIELLKTIGLDEARVRELVSQVSNLGPLMSVATEAVRKEIATVDGDPTILFRELKRRRGSPASLSWSSVRGGDQRWLDTAKRYGHGLYLSKRLSQMRAGDPQRQIKKSDLADLDHAVYLPYMDLATVDRENYGAIQGALQEVQPSRPVRVFKNGRLGDLLDALEAS